jgi:hypothetical protein
VWESGPGNGASLRNLHGKDWLDLARCRRDLSVL